MSSGPDLALRLWTEQVVALGGRTEAASVSGRDLVARYAESSRRYHDLGHVLHVASTAADLAVTLQIGAPGVHELALAALAHDVVYNGQPGADEDASAHWLQSALHDAGVPAIHRDQASRLVSGTASHRADPDDHLAAALYDADLSILGATATDYDTYVKKVRAEYAAIPDDLWAVGRGAVLRDLLERDALFVTEAGADWWDVAARANLRRELAGLP